MKLTNLNFERMLIESEDFPYNSQQNFVNLIHDDTLVLEFNENTLWIFTLDNKTIEYCLKILIIGKSNIFNFNKKHNNHVINEEFINKEVSEILYLEIDNDELNETVTTEFSSSHNLIGVKIKFSDKSELYIYSSEPEIIEDKVKIYRPNSVMSLILNSNKNKIKFENESEFSNQFFL
jgi:hypothetical protein